MLFLFLPLAASIITGNATAKTTVTNEVSGNASVETHITTSVNGKTTTIESDKPGTIEVNATNDATPTIITQQVLATQSAHPNNQQKYFTSSIISFIKTLLTQLFQKFRIGS